MKKWVISQKLEVILRARARVRARARPEVGESGTGTHTGTGTKNRFLPQLFGCLPIWLFILLLPLALSAQEWDQELFNLENNPPPLYPFSISSTYLDVSKTNFRTPGFTSRSLIYRQWDAALAYTHPFNSCAGLIFGAGWVGSEVNMEQNPDFKETLFNYVNFSVGGFTKSFPDWTWTLSLAAFLDLADFSFVDYALYQGVLWGKYDFCEEIELDFGFIVEIGLKRDKVWPLVGFIYFPRERWRLSVIYPIDISLKYDISKCVTAGGSIRFLRNRHRVAQDEPSPQSIFEYRTAGAEFDLCYNPSLWLSFTGFGGSTFNGDLRISDRNDHNAIHYKFKGSLYAGVTAILSY